MSKNSLKLCIPVIAMTLMLPACSVQAEDANDAYPNFAIHGFGTLGVVYQDQPGVKYRRDISQAGGAKAGQVSFAQDSMFGAQLTGFLSDQFEASTQVVSRLTTENDYAPQVTWAFLKYKPDEEIAIRLGRLGVEMYMQGDSAEIGYSNLMIRQPIIFYPRTFNGMDAEIIHPLGGGTARIKGFAGWMKGKVFNGGGSYDIGGSETIGAVAEYTISGLTGRYSFGYLQQDKELAELKPGAPFWTALNAAPNGARIIDGLSLKQRSYDFHSLALAYDSGPIQSIANYIIVSSEDWPSRHAFYANIGYRLEKVTPYISFSSEQTSRNFMPTGIPNGIGFDALNQAVAFAQTGLFANQSDIAIGARYDFTSNMALKFQVDHFQYKDPSSIDDSGLLALPAETRGYRSLTLFSLALDFVF